MRGDRGLSIRTTLNRPRVDGKLFTVYNSGSIAVREMLSEGM